MFNKILAISPHIDDIELACGASIAKLVEENKEVYYLALSDCRDVSPDLQKECKAALKVLGLKEKNIKIFQIENKNFPTHKREIFQILENLKEEIKPDLVIIPSLNETHQDHKTVAEEAVRAFRNTTSILSYEQPWNNLKFKPKFFIKLEKNHLDKKINALKQYKSQLKKHYFEEDFILGLARVRGCQIASKYAEAFEVIRLIK